MELPPPSRVLAIVPVECMELLQRLADGGDQDKMAASLVALHHLPSPWFDVRAAAIGGRRLSVVLRAGLASRASAAVLFEGSPSPEVTWRLADRNHQMASVVLYIPEQHGLSIRWFVDSLSHAAILSMDEAVRWHCHRVDFVRRLAHDRGLDAKVADRQGVVFRHKPHFAFRVEHCSLH